MYIHPAFKINDDEALEHLHRRGFGLLILSGSDAPQKLIQHKGETEHRGAISGLAATGEAGAQAIADMMEASARTKFGS